MIDIIIYIDDSTYDTVFLSTYGDTLILRVHWPALTSTTQLPPAMTLAGVNAKHAWLDNRMCIIGYKPIQTLQSWLSSRILLGTAVHEVVQHLQLNPPDIIEITDQGLRSIQQPKTIQQKQMQQQQQNQFVQTSNTHANSPMRSSQNNNRGVVDNNNGMNSMIQQPATYVNEAPPKYDSINNNTSGAGPGNNNLPTIDMPSTPNRFEEIDQLNRNELEILLNDHSEFTLFCNKLPIIQTYQKILNSVIDDNVIIAKKNLSQQELLTDTYNEVHILHQQLLNNISTFQLLENKQDIYCLPPDIKIVMKELNKYKKETFDESEDIANKWLQEQQYQLQQQDVPTMTTQATTASVDTFLDAFIKKRKEHHEYAAKLELLMIQSTSSSTPPPPPRY